MGTHSVVIGVARVPTPADKTIFASLPTKTAEFEEQSTRKRGSGKSITFAVYYFCLFFEVQ